MNNSQAVRRKEEKTLKRKVGLLGAFEDELDWTPSAEMYVFSKNQRKFKQN